MNYSQLSDAARGHMGPCKACPICDGRGCRSTIPGPGAKGTGNVAIRNHTAWLDYRLNMDTLHKPFEADCTGNLFGNELSVPVLIAPIGDVRRHYGDEMEDDEYNECVLRGAYEAGSFAMVGDGLMEENVLRSYEVIKGLEGSGIPTIKPWGIDVIRRRLDEALAANPVAIAMDVDAAGLPFLKGQQPPAGAKSVAELASIIDECDRPFIVKGVMTPRGAESAAKAGADAIVVSNHGGRVLDGVPSTAEVLPSIVNAVGDDLTVIVDGGIRCGCDIFRALALGADLVAMARPFAVATYAARKQGVIDLYAQLGAELCDCMEMCGTPTLDDIDEDCLFW